MSLPVVQLSCQQCTRRKTRCNKEVPCSACVGAGIACSAVHRHRLPRGRSGNSRASKQLTDRIHHLEEIVSRLQRESKDGRNNGESGFDAHHERQGSTNIDSYVASSFWLQLTDAVSELRGIIESGEETDNDPGCESILQTDRSHKIADFDQKLPDVHALLFESSLASPANDCQTIPIEMQQFLIDIYHTRVDPIIKVLHWPSFFGSLHSHGQFLGVANAVSPRRALASSVYFTACCALRDHELQGRRQLLDRCHSAAEASLRKVQLLTTTDMEVLQAFVVYLAGLRACQATAQRWVLISTAVRLATAQRLPPDETSDGSIVLESRRRLWGCIAGLDMQSAFDRGSWPLVKSDDLLALPLNVDDTELTSAPNPGLLPCSNTRFTEMTFHIVTQRVGYCYRRLAELGLSPSQATSIKQASLVADFEAYTVQLQEVVSRVQSEISKFTLAVARGSVVTMKLLIHRPLFKRPRDCIPLDTIDVLSTATAVLENTQMKRTADDFAQWAWFAWPKWFALAVVLAELCTAHGPSADHAWTVAQICYDDYANLVADTKSGLLWKPIEKLMKRVVEVRTNQSTSSQSSDEGHSLSLDSTSFMDSLDTLQLETASNSHSGGAESDPASNTDMSWLQWDLLIDDINSSYTDDVW